MSKLEDEFGFKISKQDLEIFKENEKKIRKEFYWNSQYWH
jgi:acyl carrier protein